MNKILYRDCIFCGKDNKFNVPLQYSVDHWQLKQCSDCDFIYLENVPCYELLEEKFSWEKTSEAETARKVETEPIRKTLSDLLKTIRKKWFKRDKLTKLINKYFISGRVLDIGCSSGSVLKNLKENYEPWGIEISKALAIEAQKSLKNRASQIVHANAVAGTQELPENFFRGVIMSAFLEHEANPKLLLKNVFRILMPSGYCIIKVPNFASINRVVRGKNWCGFRFPDHVNYFTPNNLIKICENIGFQIEKFTFLDRIPISDNMWIVIKKPKI